MLAEMRLRLCDIITDKQKSLINSIILNMCNACHGVCLGVLVVLNYISYINAL